MLNCQKNEFQLEPSATYLNCAYMSPLSRQVEQAGIIGIKQKNQPYLVKPQDFFENPERLRLEFSKLVNAPSQRIALIPAVSYGMAIVAKNLKIKAGENIIVVGEQFPSNVYPWLSLVEEKQAILQIVDAPWELENRGKIWNERILTAINAQTRMVALGNVHWADGTRFDLAAIRARTREVGALLVVDGTQSVGALPFDIQSIQPDALVCAGYKWLMDAYGLGLAYFGEYFDNGKPLEENWINRSQSENFANLVNYIADYQPGALRYEMGERSNFITVPMLIESIKQIQDWGVENIQEYCRTLTLQTIQELKSMGFWVEEEAYRGNHLFGVRLPKHISMEKLQAKLTENQIFVSIRGNAVRVAPHLYNDVNDMEKLVNAFKSLKI